LREITPDDLGITLMHEHLLFDLRRYYRAKENTTGGGLKVETENLFELRWDPLSSEDNLICLDEQLVKEELSAYRSLGGSAIVELSCHGLTRDIAALKRISTATGLNLICATGFYSKAFHPSYVKRSTVAHLKELILKELTEGIGSSQVRAGVIGECGCSGPFALESDEEKALVAAARAQAATGAALTVHPSESSWLRKADSATWGETYVNLIEREAADPSKFYLSHADRTCGLLDYHRRLLDRGITLSYDNFGKDYYFSGGSEGSLGKTDTERVLALTELCKQGYDKQLVLSHDTCLKTDLRRYGGPGFGHISKRILPYLLEEGVSKKQVRNILINNPRRLLAI